MTVLGSGGKLLLIALVASGVAGTTGCATRNASTEVVIRRHPTAVRVRNYNWSDARVYLLRQSGGRPVRIGTVTSMTTERIPLRGQVAAELRTHGALRFLITLIGGSTRSYTTESTFLDPRDVMTLDIANHLALTTLVVRSR